MKSKQTQFPLIQAETSWFHVFKSMVDNGDVARMGPYAVTVYLVVKAHTNYKTGKAWPGVDLIVEKSGMSKSQVLRSLATLEEHGYITKEKQGRKNVYRLREKVEFTDAEGRPAAVATWDYLPSTVKDAVAELRHFKVTGDDKSLNVIHIENLTLNIQQNIQPVDCNISQNLGTAVNEEKIRRLFAHNPDLMRKMIEFERSRQQTVPVDNPDRSE